MIANTLTSKLLAVTMAGALILPTVSTAEAGSRHHRHDAGAAIAAGVIGLAAGAVLGSALSAPRPAEPVYVGRPYPAYGGPVYAPAPVYRPVEIYQPVEVYRPAPQPIYRREVVVEYGPQAWTPEWYRYCQVKYRSFDPQTGYFVTYSGTRRFCR